MEKGKLAGYYRLSMEDVGREIESNSITNQRKLIRRFVEEDQELSEYEFCEFWDDGYSGSTMNRPGVQQLLQEIQEHKIQVVIVKDLSRFSRDYIELGTYVEQIFPFLGIRFLSIADGYDSRDCFGGAMNMDIAFKGLLSDFYCKDVSIKVRSSLEAKKGRGKYAIAHAPFGYQKDPAQPDRLTVVPEEAAVVRRIFQLSASGKGLTQICQILNQKGVLTPAEFQNQRRKKEKKALVQENLLQSKKLWQPGIVKRILTNETYLGHMFYNKTRQEAVGSGKKIVKPKETWKVFKDQHPPIIEKELFDIATLSHQRESSEEMIPICMEKR